MYKDLNQMEKRLLELEWENTEIHLKGTNLIPASKNDYLRINDIRKEIEDITDGENTLHGNMRGQFEPVCKIEPKNGEQYMTYWADELTGVSSSISSGKDLVPCFKRNNIGHRKLYINKYKCIALYPSSAITHTNYAVGLYGLSPAHSDGGFSVSYNGVTNEVAAINADTSPSYMPTAMQDLCRKKHMLTWDEYGFLCLLMKKLSFEPNGNSKRGADTQGNYGIPAAFRVNDNDLYAHTLVGSGPRTWRHNGRYTGIADIVGNVRSILSGVGVKAGIIEVIDFATNGEDLTAAQLQDESELWKAISVADGAYIDPATVDGLTVKAYCIDFTEQPTANSQKATFISDEILIRDNGFFGLVEAKDVELKEGLSAHWKIELAGYLPFKNGGLSGYQYLRNAEGSDCVYVAGGHYLSNEHIGPRYIGGNYSFGNANNLIGALLVSNFKEGD